jgi:serine/threonine protein kinase
MAPELSRGSAPSAASDIYSLGIVIFEMLTGVRPFEIHDREAFLEFASQPSMPDIRQYRPDLPTGVQVVLEQVLSKDPVARPAYAVSLAQALMRACGSSCMLHSSEEQDIAENLPEDEEPYSKERPWSRPLTPPPFSNELSSGKPDTHPSLISPSLEIELPPTVATSPTRIYHPAEEIIEPKKRRGFPVRLMLLLAWLAGLCMLMGMAAAIVLALPLFTR